MCYCKTLGGSHEEQNPGALYRAVCGSCTARAWPWDGGHGIFHVLPLASNPASYSVDINMAHTTHSRADAADHQGNSRAGSRRVGVGMSRSHNSPSFLRRPGTRPLLQPNLVQEKNTNRTCAGITADRNEQFPLRQFGCC